MKILLIEDNPGDVILIRSMLEDTDFELRVAHDLKSGFELLASEKPHLILLDLFLPDNYGMSTFTKIFSFAPHLPIILLTGNNDESLALTAVKEGAQDYLVKGKFDERWLIRAIRYAFERKQVEQWQHLHQQEKAQIGRINAMGEIALTLAHELNQPLSAITTYTQGCIRALKTENVSLEVIERLQQVVQQAERAGKIIHRLKNFTRIGELNYEKIVFNHLIRDTLNTLQLNIQSASVECQLSLAEGLPLISVDKIQLQQVLINLICNSLDALLSAKIPKPVLSIISTQQKDFIQLHIIDNGLGFTDEQAVHLFEPYFTTKPTGMGLGLAICRTIVEAHGGKITAQLHAEGGACFKLSLPIR